MQQMILTKRFWRALLAFFILALILTLIAPHATRAADISPQRSLQAQVPAAGWHTLVWDRTADELLWLNATGLQYRLPRPKLPNEAPDALPSMRVSRNGKVMIVIATLTNGRMGLGVYDFATGVFLKVHEAQAEEEISVGGKFMDNYASTRMAVGLATLNFDSPAWRVIDFDLQTGDAVAQLNSTDPGFVAMGGLPEGPLFFPHVLYYGVDVDAGEEVVHVQLLPWFTEGAPSVPAFAWYPDGSAPGLTRSVVGSPYYLTNIDLHPLSGEAIYPYLDTTKPAVVPTGPGDPYNAIGRGYLASSPEAGVQILADGNYIHYSPQWVAGYSMIVFGRLQGETYRWNLAPLEPFSISPLPTNVSAVYGFSEGLLSVVNTDEITLTDVALTTVSLYKSTTPADLTILYAPPVGTAFALTAFTPPNTGSPAFTCEGAPRTRLALGSGARVTFTDGRPLRLRDNFGSSARVIFQMPEGTPFSIIGGPRCQNNFVWWQVRLGDGRTGWAAEGTTSSYFIEPYSGPITPPVTITPTAPAATGQILGVVWRDICDSVSWNGDFRSIPSGCGSVAPATIQANGLLEPGEPGIAGISVDLGSGTCPATGLATTTTRADGTYTFAGLSAGTYCVSIDSLSVQNSAILIPGVWTNPLSTSGGRVFRTVGLTAGGISSANTFGWDYQLLP